MGSWIWTVTVADKQSTRLWRAFEVPGSSPVIRARLRITADNGFRLLLDGRELGRGSDWRSLNEYDITQLLSAGTHVLAVEAFNDRLEAGLLAGLQIDYLDGTALCIASDPTWRIVPENERGWVRRGNAPARWPAAVVVGELGTRPWVTMPFAVTTMAPFQPIVLRIWQTGWFQITLLVICGVAVFVSLHLMLELAMQSKTQNLLQRERARIARDLHDEMGSGLTQLVLQGEVTQSELPDGSDTRDQINRLCERARDLARTLDEVIWAVNSRRDTLRDFATYMCKYAQAFLQPTAVRCRLDVEMQLPATQFDLHIRRTLFLAVKEALNNSAKHAGATELFLRIHRHGAGLVVSVEDNGCGFDPENISHMRNGLTNMSQRMAEIGGQFALFTAPGQGCHVQFRVPRLHVRSTRRWLPWSSRSESTVPLEAAPVQPTPHIPQ